MVTTKQILNKGEAKIVAHRGISGIEPENTLSAFIAAGNRSYFGIETDVHKTADGKFICSHDSNTVRMTGIEAIIEETDYEVLAKMKVLDTDKASFRSDLYMPTLKEYIAVCKKYGKKAVLELKNCFNEDEIRAITDEIAELDYLDGTIFIAFDIDNLHHVRKLYPKQTVQYLVSERRCPSNFVELIEKYGFDLDAQHTLITPELIERCHGFGAEINVWTVDDPTRAEELIKMGVDQITTNICE